MLRHGDQFTSVCTQCSLAQTLSHPPQFFLALQPYKKIIIDREDLHLLSQFFAGADVAYTAAYLCLGQGPVVGQGPVLHCSTSKADIMMH